ncbi:glycosyltransferase family 4 protein [Kovacikia minuta CCNUW1]|uniref:glycosyltransferase family 4 protein n=1 Tax=Kovacikia minuta TaxID=2931930 RepID=UPI001CCDA44B|nr:glycosyltransferase family 4 protein [Kovacikia minuta]UBF27990.1 glycosyltransferase family 4 protein [Kovacikia minuta CCNUW1]
MVKKSAPPTLDFLKSGSSPNNNFTSSVSPEKFVRLSIFTQFYPPDYAATGQLIEELSNHLQHQGMAVKVFTGQPAYAFKKASAPRTERLGQLLIERSRTARLFPNRIRGKALNGLIFTLRSALHLLRACGRGDVLLLTTAPPFLPILGYLAHWLFGVPYICLLYDLYPDVAIELNVMADNHWAARLWNFINCCVWQRAESIIVLSSSMKQRVVARCPEVANKISIIHSWANPEWITPLPKERNWFAVKHQLVDQFTVLYSGNMGRCHDIDTILDVATELRNEPIRFLFIGNGAKRQECINKANRLGLNNCQFLPYQDKADLPFSLTACDLSLVTISPGMEGLVAPSKLYSALAAGRPIAAICENHSYLHQLINDARCGAVFSNGDSKGVAEFIRRLAKDHQLTNQLGLAGRHYLESHFTPDVIARQYGAVIRRSAFKKEIHPVPTQPVDISINRHLS